MFLVSGGKRLCGALEVGCAKNAVLPILAAAMLTDAPVTLEDCPDLVDARNMLSILETLGCRVERRGREVRLDASRAENHEMPEKLSKRLRSSIFLLGPLIARFGRARVSYPGGCEIGQRPIDLHLKGLRALGVQIREAHGMIECEGARLRGADVYLDFPSVGATEQLLLAACGANGPTRILGAAREPEIVTLCRYLKMAGAQIDGEGSTEIVVHGFRPVAREIRFQIPGDRIAAGSYLAAAAVTGGRIHVEGIHPSHLWSTICGFRQMGCDLRLDPEGIFLSAPERLTALPFLSTDPYPAFPTDMQSAFLAMMSLADGESVMEENVFEKRLTMAKELNRMGANIEVEGKRARCTGVERLHGAELQGADLRSGAGLIAAALAADGVSTVSGFEHVERGYENMVGILKSLGAKVWKITE